MKAPQSKKQTYGQIILNHMLAGQPISNMEAFAQYDMTCFLQRISELRDAGIPIKDKFVSCNGKRFKKYWISESDRYKDYGVKK